MSITAWEPTTAGDDVADAPLRERYVDALDNRCRHVKEAVYDETIHTPHADRPHDHCGICSPRIPWTATPNLLLGGLGTTGWTLSGGASQGTSTGLSFDGGSQVASKVILGSTAASKQAFGNGCPVTVAIVARKVGTVTTATLLFGLSDGTSPVAGARGSIDVGDLTTGFERFYFFLSDFSSSLHFTDCRVRVETAASWTGTGSLEATLVLLKPGNALSFWEPGYMETAHRGGRGTQSGPANLYDQTRDFVDATELTPA